MERVKHGVADEQRQQVIELSRHQSFREVAKAIPATQSTTTGHQPTTLLIDGESI